MQFCGIDWADEHHDALSIDDQGRQLGAIRVAHSPEGLAQLDAYLSRIADPGGKEQIVCIVETTHGLLIAHLLEQGWPVYPVNPRTVERRRAPSEAKTDTIDAYLLAKTGRADFADLRRLNPDSEQIQELKTLTRDQDGQGPLQTRLVNQLTACLKAYYPVTLEVFGKLQQPSTLAFLRAYPTLQTARSASVEDLTTTLKQARYPGARQKAEALAKHLQQPCLHASEVITRTKSRLMLALVDQLEPLLKQIAEYDKESLSFSTLIIITLLCFNILITLILRCLKTRIIRILKHNAKEGTVKHKALADNDCFSLASTSLLLRNNLRWRSGLCI